MKIFSKIDSRSELDRFLPMAIAFPGAILFLHAISAWLVRAARTPVELLCCSFGALVLFTLVVIALRRSQSSRSLALGAAIDCLGILVHFSVFADVHLLLWTLMKAVGVSILVGVIMYFRASSVVKKKG
jgi:hypothetical protein